MLHMIEALAREYMRKNPNVSIYVEGGGTALGVKALTSGDVEICAASRSLKPDEISLIAKKFGSVGMSHMIAKDAVCVYVNPDNPIRNFTIPRLKSIFSCEIDNWSELGGKDAPVTTILRSQNSGTRLYFQLHVMSGVNFCLNSLVKNTTESLVDEVRANPNAIGFGGLIEGGENVYASINGISPVEENFHSDKYPIMRYLYFYTLRAARGDTRKFIDWTISSEGQSVVKKCGFIPLWKVTF